MARTAVVLAAMPLLGRAKHTLAARVDSATTAEEGTRNHLCAALAAAVLLGLAATCWLDPAIGLGIAALAAREGTGSRRGDECC